MSSDSVLEAIITLAQVAWKKGLKTVAEAGGWPKRVAKTLLINCKENYKPGKSASRDTK
jgi:hypothetical protein